LKKIKNSVKQAKNLDIEKINVIRMLNLKNDGISKRLD
jgi:hypothetical protein